MRYSVKSPQRLDNHSVVVLHLNDNLLSGTIPTEVGALMNLGERDTFVCSIV